MKTLIWKMPLITVDRSPTQKEAFLAQEFSIPSVKYDRTTYWLNSYCDRTNPYCYSIPQIEIAHLHKDDGMWYWHFSTNPNPVLLGKIVEGFTHRALNPGTGTPVMVECTKEQAIEAAGWQIFTKEHSQEITAFPFYLQFATLRRSGQLVAIPAQEAESLLERGSKHLLFYREIDNVIDYAPRAVELPPGPDLSGML